MPYRDWSSPTALKDWHADCARQQAITAATGIGPMERAIDAMQAPARKLVAQLTKNRARVYMRQPWQLDLIWPDLSRRAPDYVLRIVEMEQERVDRHVGFGGEVRPINLKAAALLARYERRRERVAMQLEAVE